MADSRPPASPSASFDALSDDEEGGYDTVTLSESARRGVKLLFAKSKVYAHPTPSARDNIAGYIALLQQKSTARPSSASSSSSSSPASSDLLLAWLPESTLADSASLYAKADLSDQHSPSTYPYLVPPPPTVTTHSGSVGGYSFAVPLSAIFSLHVRPPNTGWWHGSVIIHARNGHGAFPALFFHDNECQSTTMQKKRLAHDSFDPFSEGGHMFWGADEVLRWLRRYVPVERSGAEPNVYLIDPSSEDVESFGRNSAAAAAASTSAAADAQDPLVKFVKETGWSIMNQFSKVTTLTRRAAQDLADNSNVPPQVRRLLRNPEVQTLQNEFDSARIYLARWAMGIAEQSERDRRGRVWTARDVAELEDSDVGEFELVDVGGLSVEERRRPVTAVEWAGWFDEAGRLSVTVDEVKERVFHGGLDPDDGVRKEAWLFLLGVYEWHGTADERRAQEASLRDQYYRLKQAWWYRLDGQGGEGEEGEWWREQRGRIEKDVHRTDRNIPLFQGEDTPHPDPNSPFYDVGTNSHLEQLKEMLLTYNEHNRSLGYVQGMSDLLSPLYATISDDALAFWAFEHFMQRMQRNFLRDQSGMRAQLVTLDQLVNLMDPKLWAHLNKADSTNFFFFFRMLLVWYKREFCWADVLALWERLWTDWCSAEMSLFVALAILEKHRDVIMGHLVAFDEVLKYVNELSNTMDLESTLIRAESLFRKFQRLVDAVDKRNNFPPPPSTSSSSPPAGDDAPRVITPELRRLLSREA
ncbi:hypothetical protein XA68_14887 [Ophiocordyceps unilateralis]|uniref:GTPase-activating protein GYP7 n=1 Tax=Ophiocordyceps unilateralis TaxID=268505 RepID=A0A2A9P9N1_OPHUN|nr:hypothetical protein XA68_14887 [Ophiocordyceps unilateralis]